MCSCLYCIRLTLPDIASIASLLQVTVIYKLYLLFIWFICSISRWPSRRSRMSCGSREIWTSCSSRTPAFVPASPWLPSWPRRTSSGCTASMSGRPRNCSSWGRLWRRWSCASILRNRRSALETNPSRSSWRCCRAKGCLPRSARRTTSRHGGWLMLRCISITWKAFWSRERGKRSWWERWEC